MFRIRRICTLEGEAGHGHVMVFTHGSPALRLHVVVVDRGNQILTVVERNATDSTGIKVTTRLP